VRFVVDLRRTEDGGVEGVVIPEGSEQGQPFAGWLELLRLLEQFEPLEDG
jgi:hypothetical protein